MLSNRKFYNIKWIMGYGWCYSLSNKETQVPSILPITPKGELKTDEDIEKETQRLFTRVFNYVKNQPEDEQVKRILEKLNNVKTDLRRYKNSGRKDTDALDKAFNEVTLAHVKTVALGMADPKGKENLYTWFGLAVSVAILWGILRAICALLGREVFLVDLFFVAVYGAFASIMLVLGSPKSRVSFRETVSKLFASPLLAVVLVALLSELTIGVGNDFSSTGISSNIGALTLRGASDGMKMSFAFVFAFFSETTVELLKDVVGKSAR